MLHTGIKEIMVSKERKSQIESDITRDGQLDVDRAIAQIDRIHSDKGMSDFMESFTYLDDDGYLDAGKDEDLYLFLPYTDEVSFEYFKINDYSVQDIVQALALVPRDYLTTDIGHRYYRIIEFQAGGQDMFSLGKVTKGRLIQDLRDYQEYRDYQVKYQRGIYIKSYDDTHPLATEHTGIATLISDYSREYNNRVRDEIWDALQEAHPRMDVVQFIDDPAKVQDMLRSAYPSIFQADTIQSYRYDYPEFR